MATFATTARPAPALTLALVLLAVDTSALEASARAGCSFNVNAGELPSPEPLFLQPSGALDVTGYLQPDGNGTVDMAVGEKMLVVCPGNNVTGLEEAVVAECKLNTIFMVNNVAYKLSALKCSSEPTHTALYTGDACGHDGRGRLARIGHNTARGLVVLAEVCFLYTTLEALYSSANVTGNIGGARTGVARPQFIPGGGFYGSVSPNSHYVRGGQMEAFAQLLGSEEQAQKYIDDNTSNGTDYFLARGHLVAKADFVWAQPQRATFYYINAAPQWQTFNGGNWERLENSVRQLAATRGRNLLVITGTWGRALLRDTKQNNTELFINALGLIPVPALFWKVVYDPANGEGAAFVGVNNPYTTLANETRLKLCRDVCASISWLSWAPESVQAGEGYCCEVDALRAAVPDVPPLQVSRLLASPSGSPSLHRPLALTLSLPLTALLLFLTM